MDDIGIVSLNGKADLPVHGVAKAFADDYGGKSGEREEIMQYPARKIEEFGKSPLPFPTRKWHGCYVDTKWFHLCQLRQILRAGEREAGNCVPRGEVLD
jgi:hypothetical protein